jgi:hypothetical protein
MATGPIRHQPRCCRPTCPATGTDHVEAAALDAQRSLSSRRLAPCLHYSMSQPGTRPGASGPHYPRPRRCDGTRAAASAVSRSAGAGPYFRLAGARSPEPVTGGGECDSSEERKETVESEDHCADVGAAAASAHCP